MRRIITIPYTLGDQFLSLIANGEADTLTDEEAAAFARLEREARSIAANGYEFAHWAITDDRDEFARCEATDLHGACTTVEAVYFHKDA